MAVVIFLSHAFLSLSLTIYGSFISLKRWAAQLPVWGFHGNYALEACIAVTPQPPFQHMDML